MIQKTSNRKTLKAMVIPEWFTVVGVYTDNRERSVRHVYAKAPERAERAVELTMDRRSQSYIIVGIFRGRLDSCDGGYADYVNSHGLF